jgi:hypothetical protein
MQPAKINYKIYQGSTFQETYRWESETKVYVPIQGIQKSAPCIITTQANHNVPQGWRIRVVGAGGMKEINSAPESYYLATNVTNTTIEINQLNSLNFTTYTTGGVIEYNQPVPLANYSARMQIRETVDSTTVLHEATTANSQIVVNDTNKTIQVTILGSVTQSFDFTTAVYSIELFNGNNVVTFAAGNITLIREVTR